MSPRTRARLLAAFVAVHVAFAVPWALVADWGWPLQMSPDTEGGAANLYSGVLWGTVGALGAAQLLRPTNFTKGPRWLWVVGWLSLATLAGFVAFEEFAELKGTPQVHALMARLNLGVHLGGMVLLVSLAAPLATAAGWVFYASLRGRPRLALLTLLAGAYAVSAVLRDTFDNTHGTLDAYLRSSPKPDPVIGPLLEEGAEVMAAAILAVVLVEMLAAGHRSTADGRKHNGIRVGRWAMLGVAVALLAASVFALAMEYQQEDERWVRGSPRFYAGPVSRVEQRFRVNRDNLARISVWAFGEGGAGATAEIFARLTPTGSDRPIRESRAEVRHERWSHKTVDFHFEPVPDSGGKSYTLAIGVLSGPEPHVYLGVTGSDTNPEDEVVINGVPSRYGNGLAMRTYWVGRGNRALEAAVTSHPSLLFPLGDLVVTVFLWVVAIVATWGGASGRLPRFWRGFVWDTVRKSGLITAGIAAVSIVLCPVLAATPRA